MQQDRKPSGWSEAVHGTLWTDGGLVLESPSPYGGAWAWVLVSGGNRRLRADSGPILPQEGRRGRITSNHAEMRAAIEGLEAMADGWAGTLYTDSLSTLLRLRHKKLGKHGMSAAFVPRLVRCFQRLGPFRVEKTKAHPTVADLNRGRTVDGVKASPWNILADGMCKEQAAFLEDQTVACSLR